MTIAHVQGATGSSTSTPFTITLTGVTAGNLLTFKAGMAGFLGSRTITGITDSSGDTWAASAVASPAESSGQTYATIWAMLATHSGTHTLTVAVSGGLAGADYFFDEWSGVASATPDVAAASAINTGASTTSPHPSNTPSQANDLVLTAVGSNGSTLSSVTSGWTALPSGTLTSPDAAAYQIQTAATAASPTFTGSSVSGWSQVIASFKATTTATGSATLHATGTFRGAGIVKQSGSATLHATGTFRGAGVPAEPDTATIHSTGTFRGAGAVVVVDADSATLHATGTFRGAATQIVSASAHPSSSGTFRGAATLHIIPHGTIASVSPRFGYGAYGQIGYGANIYGDYNPANILASSGIFRGAGTIVFLASAHLSSDGDLDSSGGAVTVSAAGQLLSSGRLGGNLAQIFHGTGHLVSTGRFRGQLAPTVPGKPGTVAVADSLRFTLTVSDSARYLILTGDSL